MNKFGFIILRHVRNSSQNTLWINCYESIRRFYSDPIVIIDDNSNQQEIQYDGTLENVTIFQSEHPGRGELLPYYYLFIHKWFEKCVFVHDSVTVHKHFDFNNVSERNAISLWYFPQMHNCRNLSGTDIHGIIKKLYGEDFGKEYVTPNYWNGCLGCMSYFTLRFVETLQKEHNFFDDMLSIIQKRYSRMQFERIIGFFIHKYKTTNPQEIALFGDQTKMHAYPRVTLSYYKKHTENFQDVFFVKTFCGR